MPYKYIRRNLSWNFGCFSTPRWIVYRISRRSLRGYEINVYLSTYLYVLMADILIILNTIVRRSRVGRYLEIMF